MGKLSKSLEEWQQELSPEVYHVTREGGTEPPFSGKYVTQNEKGTYVCACCQAPLFHSDTKYNSGSGWPSFYNVIHPDNIITLQDTRHGMVRTEIRCSQCGAHLGHRFEDGPTPTGLRYCINSVSLSHSPENND
ncbi:Peptide methionine sulfoxide reductase MsrB [invertebrate metagenome]|uniref:peptide-methionine (R)-S-oxide reductase n=1 Tax=invertebrate metagenome TaxID=1711999 RepID=A0A2H9T3W4_9ZZZZ